MTVAQQFITAEQFAQMTFDRPTELVRGEIVECAVPYSPHGAVIFAINAYLGMWNLTTKLGVFVTSDSWILTERDPDTVRGPDIFYIRNEKLANGKVPPGILTVQPDLAIEVLSPSDRRRDVPDKVSEYLRGGIVEVWVVDPDKRTLEVHRADQTPERLTTTDTLTSSELLPGFSCPVAEFFANI